LKKKGILGGRLPIRERRKIDDFEGRCNSLQTAILLKKDKKKLVKKKKRQAKIQQRGERGPRGEQVPPV